VIVPVPGTPRESATSIVNSVPAGASDAMGHETYGRDDFRIGEVVAWVFANDPDFRGYRIK